VLYTLDFPLDIAQAEVLRQNLGQIGIEVEIQKFPIQLLFQKLATPGEPFDIGRISWGGFVDGSFLNFIFDGRTIGQPNFGNWSYFDSPKFNRLLDRASRLPPGSERDRAYGQIDVQLSRGGSGDPVRLAERVHAGLEAGRLRGRQPVPGPRSCVPEVTAQSSA
jgi:ABC-type transport system substrate-binding protein